MKEIFTDTLKLTFDGKMLVSELIKDIEIDVQHVKENYEAAQRITEGKKYLSLVITTPDVSITFAAQKASMGKEQYKNNIAQAVVVHSLAQRILVNFMINFVKYPCPWQLFSNKKDAVSWLEQQWKKRIDSKVHSTVSS